MKTRLFNPGSEFDELSQKLSHDHPDIYDKEIKNAISTRTECGSSIGIVVSLIEGIMATARVLCHMDLSSMEVQEALKDLHSCIELKEIITSWKELPRGRIRD